MEGLRPCWAVKAIIVIVISSVLFRCVSATTNHSVGGPTGWDLTSDLRAWAAATAFYAGDNLVFSYGPTHDVLEVNEAGYSTCRTVDPIGVYIDGETVVQLLGGGMTRYFICGRRSYCAMGLKLEVKVLRLSQPEPPHPSPPAAPSSPNNTNGTKTPSAGDGSIVDDGHVHGGGRRRPARPGIRKPPPPPDHHLPPPNGHDECAPAPDGPCSGGVSDHTKFGIGIWPVAGFFLRCSSMLPLIAALAVIF